jgi:hypothetical protein
VSIFFTPKACNNTAQGREAYRAHPGNTHRNSRKAIQPKAESLMLNRDLESSVNQDLFCPFRASTFKNPFDPGRCPWLCCCRLSGGKPWRSRLTELTVSHFGALTVNQPR